VNWSSCPGPRGRHWGRYGAAGLLVAAYAGDGCHVLLDERADWVHQGGTIGVPGGAIHEGEQPLDAAVREAGEEVIGLERLALDVVADHVQPCEDCRRWSYTTIVVRAFELMPVRPASMESVGLHWVAVDEVERLPLHPGFAAAWPALRAVLAPRR
jgi:8-oxo-dGTP pyrophosphatase MutT (NUDIX family)